MKYIVRINPKAYNVLLKRIIPAIIWEVEQVKTRDSEKVIWHCSNVKIDGVPITKIFPLPKKGEPPTQMEFAGVCIRDGYEDAIQILTKGRHEVE